MELEYDGFVTSSFCLQITRFTEEIFAALCAGIYVYNALANMAQIGKEHQVAHNHNFTQMVNSVLPEKKKINGNFIQIE